MFKNLQLNISEDIKLKFTSISERLEDFRAPSGGDEEIQLKLVEQNQLIGMLDEQMNS
jgi:hypothetical protein